GSTDLIIVEPSLDKRTSYYKQLQKLTDFRLLDQLAPNQLASWLVEQAKLQQASLGSSDARYLVERIGNDQMRLSSELRKLIDYLPKISRQTIDLMTDPTPQSSTFDLLAAALAGDATKTLQLYSQQRQQKVEPLAILALLGWQLHILAIIKTAGDRSAAQIASQAKLNPYVVSKSQSVARQISLATLKSWVEQAAKLDIKLKRQTIDADEALQQYLLSLN
ncbi:MAG: DNA polymerase III subunit delta, partial [Candidatus Saccharimonadales bacterium]